MIKFALRRNLIYPLQLLLWNSAREVEINLIDYFFKYKDPIFYSLLMFLGEFLAGLIFYLYYKKLLTKDNKVKSSFIFKLGAIRNKKEIITDSKIKISFLLFFAAFLDLLIFVIFLYYDKLINISHSLEQRFRGIFTIYLAIFYKYILKFPIYKHQIFSLSTIGICVLIIIITEYIFIEFDIFMSGLRFFVALLLTIFILFVGALCETIEKYLLEVDKLNPYFIIKMEGLFGIFLSIIYNIYFKTFNQLAQFNKNLTNLESIMLIFSFILFIFLSGGKNVFMLLTIKIFSPMTSTFMEYILNPFYIIYSFLSGSDFLYHGKSNIIYFVINLITSLIISFCGFVYNEFLILFCCGLEIDTYNQVALRSGFENINDSYYNDDNSEINEDNETRKSPEEVELFRLVSLQE